VGNNEGSCWDWFSLVVSRADYLSPHDDGMTE